MDTDSKKYFPLPLYPSLIGAGMAVMAIEPIIWLVSTWFEPAHDSKGAWVFLLCIGLFVWSVCSERQTVTRNAQKKAVLLLLSTALIRGIGQLLAINVVGALALTLDVYALSLLAAVGTRKNALSPEWLAILFAFSLPIERILQRLIGFGLQHLSADGACLLLQGLFANVQCAGIRILLAGRDVLVDLPCSGVKTITLLCILYVALLCVLRPTLLTSLALGMVTIVSALVANIIRISCLAIFIAYPEKIGGIDVMAQPWHDLIGLLCLLLAALPLAVLSGRRDLAAPVIQQPPVQQSHPFQFSPLKTRLALSFLLLAVGIILLPRQPLDVSDNTAALSLPVYLQGQYGQAVALSEQEQSYFTQFGGSAVKMRYGNHSALLIRTTSPLRHLHTPDDCLRGLGFSVQYQGIDYQRLPTAIYIATAPNGTQWRVAVSFYSEQKQFTTNVSEVVWQWLQNPRSTWYALQRISPMQTPISVNQQWDNALFAALDL